MSSLPGAEPEPRAVTSDVGELRRELVASALLMVLVFATALLVLGAAWLLGS